MPSDYPAFPKIPRWYRDITITEKIDGTNGLISIGEHGIFAGSRNRWLTLEKDNFGFCRWVYDNADALIETLGEGNHYGEWWGAGIQRRYGLTGNDKRFSLFNTYRWAHLEDGSAVPGLGVVPVLYQGPNANWTEACLSSLKSVGSKAVYGFMKPEGIVIYHSASGSYFKATLEKDAEPKGLASYDVRAA